MRLATAEAQTGRTLMAIASPQPVRSSVTITPLRVTPVRTIKAVGRPVSCSSCCLQGLCLPCGLTIDKLGDMKKMRSTSATSMSGFMSSVQCQFCSTTNAADAKFCSHCLVQLTLAPCPYCTGVNARTALVCHACKRELVQTGVERASGGSEQARTGLARSAIDTPSRSATAQRAGGALLGIGREIHVSTEDAAANQIHGLRGPIRHALTDFSGVSGASATRNSTRLEETRTETAERGLGITSVANGTELGRLGADVVEAGTRPKDFEPARAEMDVRRRNADPTDKAVVRLHGALLPFLGRAPGRGCK